MNKTSLLEDEIRFEDVPGKYIDTWLVVKDSCSRYGYSNIKLVRVTIDKTLPELKGLVFYFSCEFDGNKINRSVVIDSIDIECMYRQRLNLPLI